MSNSINKKKLVATLAGVGVAILLIVLMFSANKAKSGGICKAVNIKMATLDDDNSFLEEADIKRTIRQVYNDSLPGQPLETIDLSLLEKALKANPYVKKAEVFLNMNNEIKIQVSQRQPIIRVIHIRGVDYYIDDAGLKVPASPNFTAHVPIVTGNIKDSAGVEGELKTQNTKDIFTLAKFIRENDFWKAQIEQVIVSPDAEFELIPKIADLSLIHISEPTRP